MTISAVDVQTLARWKQSWMDWTLQKISIPNPLLQPRMLIALGCVGRGKMSLELVVKILPVLEASLSHSNDFLASTAVFSLACLADEMIPREEIQSRNRNQKTCASMVSMVGALTWLGVSICFLDSIAIVTQGLHFLIATLACVPSLGSSHYSSARDFFSILLHPPQGLSKMAQNLGLSFGIDFQKEFGFSLMMVLMRGLRHVPTRPLVKAFLFLLTTLWSESVRPTGLDTQATCDPVHPLDENWVVGILVPLLPYLDLRETHDLVGRLNLPMPPLRLHHPSASLSRTQYYWLLTHFSISSQQQCDLLVASFSAILESTPSEAEIEMISASFTELAVALPQMISPMFVGAGVGMG